MYFRKRLDSVDFVRGKMGVGVESFLVCFDLFLVKPPSTMLVFYGSFFVADVERGEDKDCNETASNDNWHENSHCESRM